jgi:hypothetical protein
VEEEEAPKKDSTGGYQEVAIDSALKQLFARRILLILGVALSAF